MVSIKEALYKLKKELKFRLGTFHTAGEKSGEKSSI